MEAILITVLGFLVVALGFGRVSDLRSKKKLKDTAVGALEDEQARVAEDRDERMEEIDAALDDRRNLGPVARVRLAAARARRRIRRGEPGADR